MKLDPNLLQHPKYLRLFKIFGSDILTFLVRIWGHCEQSRRGEWWEGADDEYVEIVAGWTGSPGVLADALAAVRWIHREEGGIRIHDWDKTNWRAVTSWNAVGKGGRKTKSEEGPSRPKSQPSNGLDCNPRNLKPAKMSDPNILKDLRCQSELSGVELKGDDIAPLPPVASEPPPAEPTDGLAATSSSGFEVPSEREVLDFITTTQPVLATGCPAIEPDWALAHQKRWQLRPEKTPGDWRGTLTRWWRADWAKGLNRPGTEKAPGVWHMTKERDGLLEQIRDHPFNPGSSAFVGDEFRGAFPDRFSTGTQELVRLKGKLREIEKKVGAS